MEPTVLRIIIRIIPLLLIASTVFAQQEEQVLLALIYNEGDSLRYKVTTESESENLMVSSRLVLIQTLLQKVVEVTDRGDATIEVIYERFQTFMETGEEMRAYDSDDEEATDDPLSQMYSAVVGHSFVMTVSSDGTVLEVTGSDESVQNILSDMGSDEPVTRILKPMLEQSYSNEIVKAEMQFYMHPFLREPVSPGATWNREFKEPNPMFGQLESSVEYEFKSLDMIDGRLIAVVALNGTIAISEEGPSSQLAAQVSISIDEAEMSGAIELDVVRGVVLKSTVDRTMQVTMAGMKVPVTGRLIMELVP